MAKKKVIPHRNRNQTGWWIFSEVQQWVSNRQKILTPGSKCFVYENLRLLQADSREAAYRKALRMGGEGYPMKTEGGEWRFAGIAMLLPVCEAIEDGVEVLWKTRGEMTVSKIQKLVKSKKELPVFDDSDKED